MTQEEKDLLLKDICERLRYGVICQFTWTYNNETTYGEDVTAKENDNIRGIDIPTKEVQADYYGEWVDLEHCKPYLRPMSSMTEEERNEYNDIVKNTIDFYNCPKSEEICFFITPIDWLNAHHFDYRGLIEKGLAFEAKEGMYKTV